ncbi:MAG: alpha/beta hydrolase domain-containing protein [Acidimicrobiales bacterium]
MSVERFEIKARAPYLDGRAFGDVGGYERIDAVAHYAVDPDRPENRGIVDLGLAERGEDGLVRFDGDLTVLRPMDAERGCRTALVEVPNRGRRTASSLYNRAPVVIEPTVEVDPGDGFLFRRGWTMAWCGWQWDVPRSPARMGLTAPVVLDSRGEVESAQVQLRLQLHQPARALDLTDHHVGLLGGHTPLPTADIDDPTARLVRRDLLWGEPEEIPRHKWRFARDDDGRPSPDATHIWLDDGFEPGPIYDLIYRSAPCRIPGAGLLAVRDFGAFLRSGADPNPCAGELDHLIVAGQSQCGRFLRTFLDVGLNRTEGGAAAYDGVLSHIAGGRRGEFNHRGGQPSVQPTPSFGHRFPFADDPQDDARTGRRAGLLDRQREVGAMPKIFYTNTSSEYWRGDASLAHSSVADGSDVDPPAETRHYLFSSTQHGPGILPLMSESIFGSRGGNNFNIVDYTPLMRAALVNLRSWIVDGIDPPPNAVPRIDDGTAVERAAVLHQVRAIPDFAAPTATGLSTIRPLDLGPGEAEGIGGFPAVPTGDPYPCIVAAVDDDGNERAGIPMPDIEVPVATHAGWNPRHRSTGADEQILEYIGSTVPFAVDATARTAAGDPRPSIAERYTDRDDYLARVRTAAEARLEARHIVEEDVETCVRIAAARYDALSPAAAAVSG